MLYVPELTRFTLRTTPRGARSWYGADPSSLTLVCAVQGPPALGTTGSWLTLALSLGMAVLTTGQSVLSHTFHGFLFRLVAVGTYSRSCEETGTHGVFPPLCGGGRPVSTGARPCGAGSRSKTRSAGRLGQQAEQSRGRGAPTQGGPPEKMHSCTFDFPVSIFVARFFSRSLNLVHDFLVFVS